jgi:hypothetical protein
LEALKAAGDVFADRLPHRGCVARFKRADNVLVLAYESRHIAWPTAIGRARDLLVISEPAIGLGKQRVVRKRDQFDMKAFVQRNEVPERLERRAVRPRGDQAIDGLEMIKRFAVAALDCERRGACLKYEARFEELAKLVVSWAQSDAIALVALEGDKTLGVKASQGFAHWNKTRAKDLRELVDDDALAVGEPAIGDQPMQFVVREIDKASERGRRNRLRLVPERQAWRS